MFAVGIRQIQSDQAIPLIINSYGNCISGKNELTILRVNGCDNLLFGGLVGTSYFEHQAAVME